MSGRETNEPTASHVDDLVELFALGLLDRNEADFVASHAATCGRCSRLIGLAEATVVALAEATVPAVAAPAKLGARIRASAFEIERPTRGRNTFFAQRRNAFLAYAALAAALLFAIGTVFEVRAIFAMRHAAAQNDVALVALVDSHFTHQAFEKVVPAAPAAKVLLGRSPHWLYVIVDSPACRCRVYAATSSGVRDLGPPVAHERTSTLFVPDIPAVSELDLRDGTRVLATVRFANTARSGR